MSLGYVVYYFLMTQDMLACILSCAFLIGKRRFKAVKFSKSMLEVAEFDKNWELSTESYKSTGS